MKEENGDRTVTFTKPKYKCHKIEKPTKYSWIFNVFVAFDQFGNAIAFGNPDSTISARVGFFSIRGPGYLKHYWKFLERIINWAFWPVDGKNHCRQAFCKDPYEAYILGNQLAWFILSIIVLVFCIVIGVILYVVYLFYPNMKKELICPVCQGEEGQFGYEKAEKDKADSK